MKKLKNQPKLVFKNNAERCSDACNTHHFFITIPLRDGMAGRIIETRSINADQQIQLGEKYRDGIYVVGILQGKKVKQLKLVKLPG